MPACLMLESGEAPSRELRHHIDRCLSCLSCMTTCPSGVDYMHLVDLTRAEIEGVGFKYADLAEMTRCYDPAKLKDGFNTLPGGERIFYISNPALGLWAYRGRFTG